MTTRESIRPLVEKISHETIREAFVHLANEIDLLRLDHQAKLGVAHEAMVGVMQRVEAMESSPTKQKRKVCQEESK